MKRIQMAEAKKIRELYGPRSEGKLQPNDLRDKFHRGIVTIWSVLLNERLYDPDYTPPSSFPDGREHDKYVEREKADKYPLRCPVCGSGVYVNDINSPNYGKPFKNTKDAKMCCHFAPKKKKPNRPTGWERLGKVVSNHD